MAASNKDERKKFPSAAFPLYKKIKMTNGAAAQPETANTVDNHPAEDPSPFRFTWRIDRFSSLNTKKIYSDVFKVGGYKCFILVNICIYRLMLFPNGNVFPNGNDVDYLSMYLDVVDSDSLPYGWNKFAEFSLTVVNQINYKYSVRKDTQHQFNKQESDWGFTSFIHLGKLHNGLTGYLMNDTLLVEVEVNCNVDEKDTAEHFKKSLKKEKKHKNKENAEAHLYTIIKVVRDEDLAKQSGKNIHFDLVDHDKVRSFRVQKQTPFKVFKEEVFKEFGIPTQYQRFWVFAKRENYTCRPVRPLTHIEEAGQVGQLRVIKKVHKTEFKLFLEVERGPDLRPIAPLKKGKDDRLLFFKLYDPEKEKLRYVGRLFVNCTHKPSVILTKLNELACYDPDEELELYEEILFEPNVMCEPVDKNLTFEENELENGDIICFQKASAMDNGKHIRYPDVPSYLEYVRNRQFDFSPSFEESDDEESLEEQNKNIKVEETNDEKSTEAQHSEVDIENTHDKCVCSVDLDEIDAMIDEDVIAAIDKVLSDGITISLKSHHSVQRQEKVTKFDPNLSKQLLEELKDIAFKEDLIEKIKEGFTPKVNLNVLKEKIDANANAFSSRQLEQVNDIVNLLNNILRMFEKLENLKKERDSAKKSTVQDNEALKETRQKILTSKSCLTDQETQINSLDVQIADLKAKLEKLQGDKDRISEIQHLEKDKMTSLNREVKSIFHRLAGDQVKLKSVEDKIPEAETELENHEKLYQILRAVPPF